MSKRQDKERENELQPVRMSFAIKELKERGYEVTQVNDTLLQFKHPNDFSGKTINYFPYSGWASGSTIKDGRGLEKLLRQLNKNNYENI